MLAHTHSPIPSCLYVQGTQISAISDVEPSTVCNGDASCYDPSILNMIDDLMVDAKSYGVKIGRAHV